MDLFVKVDLLLSNHIKFSYLIVDDSLPLFKSAVDFANLILDFLDLDFSFFYHLLCICDLVVQVLLVFASFLALKVAEHQGLALLQELGLLL